MPLMRQVGIRPGHTSLRTLNGKREVREPMGTQSDGPKTHQSGEGIDLTAEIVNVGELAVDRCKPDIGYLIETF